MTTESDFDFCYVIPWRSRSGEWREMKLYGPRTEASVKRWVDYCRRQCPEIGEVEVRIGPRPTVDQVCSARGIPGGKPPAGEPCN